MCTVAFRVSKRLCACARIHAICPIMPSGRRAKPKRVCALPAGFTQSPSHLCSEHRDIQARNGHSERTLLNYFETREQQTTSVTRRNRAMRYARTAARQAGVSYETTLMRYETHYNHVVTTHGATIIVIESILLRVLQSSYGRGRCRQVFASYFHKALLTRP